MILTVTPNVAVDKTYQIPGFRLDRVNRPQTTFTVAGGKGINVARVYQTLGGKAVATGFLGGIQGQIVARALAEENITNACLPVEGETRICIAVVDPLTGEQTEVNESGPMLTMDDAERLIERIRTLLSQSAFEFVVLSGSLPPGIPTDFYASILNEVRRFNVRTVLDASGVALKSGISACPWLIKPNRVELETILGRTVTCENEILETAKSLLDLGIAYVLVSLGEEGAILVCNEGAWKSKPPKIDFVSAVASGDTFVAAFLWNWNHANSPGSPEGSLRLATTGQ